VVDADNPVGSVGAILQDAGALPRVACRVFTLEGDYAAVTSSLKTMAARELAVLPESLDLRVGGRNRWEISVWL